MKYNNIYVILEYISIYYMKKVYKVNEYVFISMYVYLYKIVI